MIGRRRHPRRPAPTVHRPPPVAPETPAEVLARALDEPVPAEVLDESPPPLRKDQIARLGALTATWVREVRVGGPMPEDTLLYAAPKPPVPKRGQPEPAPVDEEDPPALMDEPLEQAAPLEPLEQDPPKVVRDWVSRHDPRSREFDVKARLRHKVPIQDRVWEPGPVFDQGTTPPLSVRDASGCVGMATGAAANVLALAAGRSDLLSKDDALGLYDRAQRLDHVSGEAYAGTSVLAGMLAGREAGLWAEFVWAFGTRDIAQAILQLGPVVVGIPWDTRLEEPDTAGIVTPGGQPAGGHALAVVGIVTARAGKPGPFFVLQQSRGEAEGDRGLIYLHHKHLSALLAGIGEAAIPVPPGLAQ